LHDFEATTGLQCPLSTLHERRCRHPCKTRFRLAGSAFTGRVSNPLGHDERFQVTSILLSRTCPDASWAHVRRPFYELAETSPVAADALARIATLYAIDAEARGQSPEQRRAARREKSRPVVDELRRFLDAKLAQLSRKSTLAEAIRYALTRWEGLTRFLDDGRIELDSNVVERTIRPLALNRKNSLFAGSDDGGDHWAVIASMIETCKLNGIDPQAWLTDTLTRLAAGHSNLRRDQLMPWNYVPAVG
jgi:transposase